MRRAPTTVDARAIRTYRRALDRVFAQAGELIAGAPTWQAGLYAAVRACYAEMRGDEEALRLHFVATASDPLVQRIRTEHRNRMIGRLREVRADAPPTLHAELMLSMIHASLRRQVIAGERPPKLEDAEQTFAGLLFHYGHAA